MEELKRVLSRDPEIISKYGSQEERSNGKKYQKEELEVFKAKIDYFQKMMNVKVILDNNVSSSRLLGKNHPETVKAGKPVILINPEKIFKTTAIHEFAHVFVDSFIGGVDNPRIKKAYEMLKGTEIEAEVKEMYPELSEEPFIKELIVTAMGREGSEMWDSKEKESTWNAIKNWFFDFLKRTFGFSDKNEIIALTKDLLSEKFDKNIALERVA